MCTSQHPIKNVQDKKKIIISHTCHKVPIVDLFIEMYSLVFRQLNPYHCFFIS